MHLIASESIRLSRPYLLLTLGIFALELFIALEVHDAFVRPFVGDVLVVVLIYCAVRRHRRFNLFGALEHNAVLRTVIGTHADPLDVLAYAIGTGLIVLVERIT
jgi:hypothetical protein